MIEEAVIKATTPLGNEIEMLKAEIVEIKKSQEFVCDKYDEIKSECQDLTTKPRQQNQEVKNVKGLAVALEKNHVDNKDKLDDIEQHTRRQNLIFEGIPVSEGEDINKTIISCQLVEKLNLKITDQDISIAHRLPSKKRITENIRESNQRLYT